MDRRDTKLLIEMGISNLSGTGFTIDTPSDYFREVGRRARVKVQDVLSSGSRKIYYGHDAIFNERGVKEGIIKFFTSQSQSWIVKDIPGDSKYATHLHFQIKLTEEEVI